jgi:hypothetical protein
MAQQENRITDRAAISAAPAERTHFNQLVMSNPNYFGTLPKFGGEVKKPISSNTTYEHLACIGLNPGGFLGSGLLEAIVDITQHSGYGTDACGNGSTEYVRFFVQDASGWHDLGSSSVQVFDVPGARPLSYAVSVDFNEARKFCSTENIVNVRAILSWQWDPTPGDPHFVPVWGNVVNAKVQVAPSLFAHISIADLLSDKAITLDPGILHEIDLAQPLPTHPPVPLTFAELKKLYAKAEVPSHRFGFSEATQVAGQSLGKLLSPVTAGSLAGKGSPVAQLTTLTSDISSIIAQLVDISGDITFEELTCAGYNPQTRELEGVIQIRKNAGYSGSLCHAGSTEYVSFFAFFGGVWHALGTTQVQVHDLAAVTPGHPISYAVFRLSNLTSMPCENLDAIPLRAILSWETPPTGPHFVPVWGNIVDTHVQPQIAPSDNEQARLMRIGRVTINGIDGNGFAMDMGSATIAGDCTGNNSPFGGETIVEGDFLPRVDVFNHTTGALLPGAKPIIYQVMVTPFGGSPSQLLNAFNLALFPPNSMVPVVQTQQAAVAPGPVSGGLPPTAQFYTYWESDLQAVNPRTLAVFEAGGLSEGKYTVEIHGFKWNGLAYHAIPVVSKLIYVYNGYPHMEIALGGVIVPEQRPQVSLTITSPSGDCGDVQVGETIHGSYSVTDNFFGSVSVALVPITVSGVPQPESPVLLSTANSGPSAVVFDSHHPLVVPTGTSGTFTLDTTGMTPCGYTILLQAWDRALVNNTCSGHYNEEGVGFCLRRAHS